MAIDGSRGDFAARLLDAAGAGRSYAERAGVGAFSAGVAKGDRAERDLAGQELEAQVRAVLARLPPQARELVIWHLAGVTRKRMAATLGVTAATVTRRLNATLEELRRLLGAPR